MSKHTGFDNSINKVLSWNEAIIVLVHLSEQVSETRFLVVHKLKELEKQKK